MEPCDAFALGAEHRCLQQSPPTAMRDDSKGKRRRPQLAAEDDGTIRRRGKGGAERRGLDRRRHGYGYANPRLERHSRRNRRTDKNCSADDRGELSFVVQNATLAST